MRKTATVLLVASLVVMVFSGFQPSSAEDPGEVIGEYLQLGSANDLTTSHTSWVNDVLEVEGPPLTNKLKVEAEFLGGELGAWSSDREFTVGADVIEFDSRDVSIVNLSLGPEPVFTMGASDQLEFLERPMWIGVEQTEYGDPITLDLEDGDPSGQQIYIAKDWLWDRGIHKPNATHEDGTVLAVNQSEDRQGFIVDVHHFSEVVINPIDLTVMGKEGGLLFPHSGERRWYGDENRLEIDVDEKSSNYQVWVEKDWVDMKIESPALHNYFWEVDEHLGDLYYVVFLTPDETPETLVFDQFTIDEGWVFSHGSKNLAFFQYPLMVSSSLQEGNLSIEYESPDSLRDTIPVMVNMTAVAYWNITLPIIFNNNTQIAHVGTDDGNIMFQIVNPTGVFSIVSSPPWEPIEEFVGLPDPDEWLVDVETGIHYRRTTEIERENNNWLIGSYLVEAGDIKTAKNGLNEVTVTTPFNDTVVNSFDASLSKTSNVTATAVYSNGMGTTETHNSSIFYYTEVVSNLTGALLLATDGGGITGLTAVDGRIGSMQGPKNHWNLSGDIGLPEGVPFEGLVLVQLMHDRSSENFVFCSDILVFNGAEELCDDGGGDPPDPPSGPVTFNFQLHGEIKWCTENRGVSGEDWIAEMEVFASAITTGFEATNADLFSEGRNCWFAESMSDAYNCDSGVANCWDHCEDGVCWHKYPYNGCDGAVECYKENAWSDVDHTRLHEEFAGLSLVQVIHQGTFDSDDGCGQAHFPSGDGDLDGASASADWVNYGGCSPNVFTHEVGHNFNAIHCDANVDLVTVMTASRSQAGHECGDPDQGSDNRENRLNSFSTTNRNTIDQCVEEYGCPRTGTR